MMVLSSGLSFEVIFLYIKPMDALTIGTTIKLTEVRNNSSLSSESSVEFGMSDGDSSSLEFGTSDGASLSSEFDISDDASLEKNKAARF